MKCAIFSMRCVVHLFFKQRTEKKPEHVERENGGPGGKEGK
jgi:hypothetical protein